MPQLMIHFCNDEGSELEECWQSEDAFRSWAAAEGWQGVYSVYEEDEDGDWLLIGRGRLR